MQLLSLPICRSIGQLKKAKKTICCIKVICLLMACGLTSQSVVAESNKPLFITLGSQLEPSLGVTGNQPLVLNDQCSIQQRNGKVTDISNCPVGDYNYVKSDVSSDVISKDINDSLTLINQLVIDTNSRLQAEQENVTEHCKTIDTGRFELVWEKRWWGWFPYYYPQWKPILMELCEDKLNRPELAAKLDTALDIVKLLHGNLKKINDDGFSPESIKNLNENYTKLKKHYPISNLDLEINSNAKETLEKLINLKVYKVIVKNSPPALNEYSVGIEVDTSTNVYETSINELWSLARVEDDYGGSKKGIYIESTSGAGAWKYCDPTCQVIRDSNKWFKADNDATLRYQPVVHNDDIESANLSFKAWDQTDKTDNSISDLPADLFFNKEQVINYITIGTADPNYIFYDGFIDMTEDKPSSLRANISKNQNNPVEFKVLEGYEDDQYTLILEVDSGQLVHYQERGRKIILSDSLSQLQVVIDEGHIKYHPDKDFNGEVLLTLTLAQQNDRQSQSKQTFSLNIEAVNDHPTFANQEPKKLPKLYENEAEWSFEHPKAEDVDYDKLTYRLEHQKEFSLKGGKIVLNDKLDYETKPEYELILTADDNQGGIAELEITVKVKDVNEAPEITSDLTEYVIQDNKVGDGFNRQFIQFKLTATDVDNGDQNSLDYSIIDTNDGQLIEDENGEKNKYQSQYGTLTFDRINGDYKYVPLPETIDAINNLKFGRVIEDSFKLAVKDTGGLTATTDFTVKLQNTNNPPTLGKLTCFDTQDNDRQVKVLFDDGYYKCQVEINDPDTQTTAWNLKVGDENIPDPYKKNDKFTFNPSKEDINNQYIQITVIDGGESKSKIYDSQSLSLKPTTAKTSGLIKGRFSKGEIKAHTDDSTLKWTSYRNKINYTVKHAASKNCQNPTVKWHQELDDKWHPVDIQLMDINGDTLDDLLVFSSDKTTTKVSIHYNRVLKKHECLRVWEESPKKINLVEKLANFTHPTSIKSITGLHGEHLPVRYFLLHSHITGKARVVALKFDDSGVTLIEPTSDTTSEPTPNQDKKAVAVLTADISWLGDWNGVKVKESEQKSRFNANAVIVGQLVTERKQDGTVNFSELTPGKVWVDYVTYSLNDGQSMLLEDAERGKVDDSHPSKHLILLEETNMSDIQAHHLSSVWVHAPQPAAPELYSSLDQTKFLLQSTDLDMNDEPEYFIVRDNVASKKDKLSAMTLQSEKAGEQSKHRRQLQQISTDVPLNIIHAHSPQLASEAGFIMQTPTGIARHIAANCEEDQLFSQCFDDWKEQVEWHKEVKVAGNESDTGRRILKEVSLNEKIFEILHQASQMADKLVVKEVLDELNRMDSTIQELTGKELGLDAILVNPELASELENILLKDVEGIEMGEITAPLALLKENQVIVSTVLINDLYVKAQKIKAKDNGLAWATSEQEHTPADKVFNTKTRDNKNTVTFIDRIHKYVDSKKRDLENPSSQSIPNILELGNGGENSTIGACPDDKDKLCVDNIFIISELESQQPKINFINQDRDNLINPKVSPADDNSGAIKITMETVLGKTVQLVYVPIGVDSNNKVKFGLALMEHNIYGKKIIRKTWDYADGNVVLFKRGKVNGFGDTNKFNHSYVKAYYYGYHKESQDTQKTDQQPQDKVKKYLDYTVAMDILADSQSTKKVSSSTREHYYYSKDKAGEGLKLKSKYQERESSKREEGELVLAQINCDQGNNCTSLNNDAKEGDRKYYTVPDYAYLPVDDKWVKVYGVEIEGSSLELLIATHAENGKDISNLEQISPPGYEKDPKSFVKISSTEELLKDTNKTTYYFPSYKTQLEAIALMTLSLNQKVDAEQVANDFIEQLYNEYRDTEEFSKLDDNDKEKLNKLNTDIKLELKASFDKAYTKASNVLGYSYNSDSSSDDLKQLISASNNLSVSKLKKNLTKTTMGSCPSGELVWVLEDGSPNDMLFASMASTLLDNDFVQRVKAQHGKNNHRFLKSGNTELKRTIYKMKDGKRLQVQPFSEGGKNYGYIKNKKHSYEQLYLYRDIRAYIEGVGEKLKKGNVIREDDHEFYLIKKDASYSEFKAFTKDNTNLDKFEKIAVVTGNYDVESAQNLRNGSKYFYPYVVKEDKSKRKVLGISYRFPDNTNFTTFTTFKGYKIKTKLQHNLGGFSQINYKQSFPTHENYISLVQVYQLQCATALGFTNALPLEGDTLLRLKRSVNYDKHGYLFFKDEDKTRVHEPDKDNTRHTYAVSLDLDLRAMINFDRGILNEADHNHQPSMFIFNRLKNIKINQVGVKLAELITSFDFREIDRKNGTENILGPTIERLILNPLLMEYNPYGHGCASLVFALGAFGVDALIARMNEIDKKIKVSSEINFARHMSQQVMFDKDPIIPIPIWIPTGKIGILGEIECPSILRHTLVPLVNYRLRFFGRFPVGRLTMDCNLLEKLPGRKIRGEDKMTFGNMTRSYQIINPHGKHNILEGETIYYEEDAEPD